MRRVIPSRSTSAARFPLFRGFWSVVTLGGALLTPGLAEGDATLPPKKNAKTPPSKKPVPGPAPSKKPAPRPRPRPEPELGGVISTVVAPKFPIADEKPRPLPPARPRPAPPKLMGKMAAPDNPLLDEVEPKPIAPRPAPSGPSTRLLLHPHDPGEPCFALDGDDERLA